MFDKFFLVLFFRGDFFLGFMGGIFRECCVEKGEEFGIGWVGYEIVDFSILVYERKKNVIFYLDIFDWFEFCSYRRFG